MRGDFIITYHLAKCKLADFTFQKLLRLSQTRRFFEKYIAWYNNNYMYCMGTIKLLIAKNFFHLYENVLNLFKLLVCNTKHYCFLIIFLDTNR